MFLSNFEKLKASQPQPATKRKQPTEDKPAPKQNIKMTGAAKKIDQERLTQLQELSKLTALNSKGEKKIFQPKKKIDLSAPPKLGVQVINHFKNHQQKLNDGKTFLSNEEYGLLRQQKDRIDLYKKEWYQTRKQKISVPPLYDPIVISYHYGLGQRQTSIFEEADRIRWKLEHPNRPYEPQEDDSCYEHILLRIVVATKYGEVIYDKLVQPKSKVLNYRTEITGITKQDFKIEFNPDGSVKKSTTGKPEVLPLERVIADMSEIVDNRIVVGYNLTAQNIHKTSVKALVAQFQENHKLNKQEIDEMLLDKRIDQKSRAKNQLFDMLMLSHPAYLVRDLLSGIPFPVRYTKDGKVPQLEQLLEQYLKSVPIDLTTKGGANNLTGKDKSAQFDKSTPMMDYASLKIDKFTYMNSKPIGFVSLDKLLNNAFDMLQVYYLYKLKWEKIATKASPTQIKQYKTKILKIMKQIEKEKEISEIVTQNRREKVLRQREKRKLRQEGGADSDDDRWAGADSDSDSDDLSDSEFSDDSD